jgi:hypothetical protein
MDCEVTVWSGVDWIQLTHSRDQWLALVKMVKNLKMLGISRLPEELLTLQG